MKTRNTLNFPAVMGIAFSVSFVILFFTTGITKEVVISYVVLTVIAIYSRHSYIKKKFMLLFVNELTVDDFTFETSVSTFRLNIEDISVEKIKALCGDTEIKLSVSVICGNLLNIGGDSVYYITESEYKEFTDYIGDCKYIDCETYALTAKMKDNKRYRYMMRIKELKYEANRIVPRREHDTLQNILDRLKTYEKYTDYISFRFVLPKLKNDEKPYSSEDYGNFFIEIKDEMMKRLIL